MTNRVVPMVTLALILTACGAGQDPPTTPEASAAVQTPVSPPPVVVNTSGTLSVSGTLSGLSVTGPSAQLKFGVVTPDPSTTLTLSRVADVPMLPPVDTVNSSYLMGEVPGRVPLGAWRVVTNVRGLKNPASLTLDRPLSAQAAPQTVTEVFTRDNLTGQVSVVGTFQGASELRLEDFGDLLDHNFRHGRAKTDVTYFAYQADAAAYLRTCTAEGGKLVQPQGYCSFADKQVAPVRAQGIGPVTPAALKAQALNNLTILSWNLGNVAQSCGRDTLGANYNYKLCYSQTERRVSDTVLAQEKVKKPAVIFFQEIWHGDCRYTPESDYGTYTNQRVCASTAPNNFQNSAVHILGISRYYTECTRTENLPADSMIANGYECVSIDPQVFNPDYSYRPANGGNVSGEFHPPCDINNTDPAHDYPGRDTGYAYMNVVPANTTGPNIMLISSHLVGTNNAACRTTQLKGLQGYTPAAVQNLLLIAGDFNTDPNASSDSGAATYRSVFSGTWGTPYPRLADEIDDPTQPTAFYSFGTQNLDHVLGRGFGGSCRRGPDFDGTDHTYSLCTVSAPGY